MYDYKHDNSSFWNQRKFTKTVKLNPKLNIALTNRAPGIKQYKSYLMNQEETPNRNASVFETHIISEDEPDKGQNEDDDELSFQCPDPIQAINISETGCRAGHPNETTTEDIQQTHNDATYAGEFSLELLHTIQMIGNQLLLVLKMN